MSNFKFFTTPEFEREFKNLRKKYSSLPNDLREFQKEVIKNPELGVDLGSNIRKIRISIKSKGKGKSGGARVISYNIITDIIDRTIVLVTIYDKSETDTVSIKHIKSIIKRNGF